MTVRNVEMAHDQLGQYFEDFMHAIDTGTRRFWEKYADDAYKLTKSCRASILRCLIADELKQRLDGRPGIGILDEMETTTFTFANDWVLRIHKLDEGGQTAPNDTQMRLDLDDNDLNGLSGLPPTATVVYLGYVEIIADRLNPEMRLACPDGDKPAWMIDLRATLIAPPAPPVEGTGADDTGTGTRVVVKRQDRKASH